MDHDLASTFDTLISNASVVDGSGEPAYLADVALKDGRIVRIARGGGLREARAGEEIDASGLVLAPGFIDVHTHDDTVVIEQPAMLPKLSQGVTTVVVVVASGASSSSAMPFLKALMPLAASPISSEILPRPNSSITTMPTMSQCQMLAPPMTGLPFDSHTAATARDRRARCLRCVQPGS